MSSIDRDPSRKVSQPTQKDFLHGMTHGTDANNGKGLVGFAVGYILGRLGQRGRL